MNNSYVKRYNPNSFNALDSAIAFLSLLLLFLVVDEVITRVASSVRDRVENFDYYLFLCISSILIQGVIFAVAFVFCKIRHVSVFDGGGFVYKFDFVKILFAIILTSGIFFIVSHAHFTFVEDVFEIVYGRSYADYTAELDRVYKGDDFYALIYIYVLTPLLPCVCEEIMFRGVVMRGLRQFGVTASVILSSLCFTFMHGNVEQIVLQFAIGLAIGAVVTVTDNFLIGAAMHFANNFFNSLYSVTQNFTGFIAEGGDKLFESIYIVIGVVFTIIGGYYFLRLALNKREKMIKGTPTEIAFKDRNYYALVRRDGESQQKLYPAQVDYSLICDGTFYFDNNGIERRVNKRSNEVLSIILIAFSLVVSVVIIFIV